MSQQGSARDMLAEMDDEETRTEYQYEDPIGPVEDGAIPWYEIRSE